VAQLELSRLVILPPHLPAIAEIQQRVVVAVTVEHDEPGERLIDRAEVRVVDPEMRVDEIRDRLIRQLLVDDDLRADRHPVKPRQHHHAVSDKSISARSLCSMT
jgi:hypothetical protein